MFRIHKNERRADKVLRQYLPFYKSLPANFKPEFRRRVNLFIRDKTFRGGKGFNINFEHMVAIAGSAIQVSFGNKRFLMDRFHTIIIYEGVYQNPITKNYHRGEVNPSAGIIVISWKDFVFGYSTDEDNLNVGLHEMAHAYYFDIVTKREEIESEYDLLSKYLFVSEKEILKIRKNRSSLFRNYAGENVFEFFAVSVEYFFESGKDFREKLPQMYRQMCLLLNQDSAEKSFRGFSYTQYFNDTHIVKEMPAESDIILPHWQSNVSVSNTEEILPTVFLTAFTIIILFISIFSLSPAAILFFVIGLALLIRQIIKMQTSRVFATDKYLYISRKDLSSIKVIGIPFNGIIAAEIDRNENSLSIKYNAGNKLKQIRLTPRSFGSRSQIERLLVLNNVMIKMDGLRVPRIKTHKN